MKKNILFIIMLLTCSTLPGCSSASKKAPATEPENNAQKASDVEMVPAREDENSGRKWKLKVEEDGSFYEMLPEDDRLCADCDR